MKKPYSGYLGFTPFVKSHRKITLTGRKLRIPIHLKVYFKDGRVLSYVGTKKSQVRGRLVRVSHQNVKKYYVKVVYGRTKDVFGKMTTFDNSGEYQTKEELFYALSAFTEKDLLKDWI